MDDWLEAATLEFWGFDVLFYRGYFAESIVLTL